MVRISRRRMLSSRKTGQFTTNRKVEEKQRTEELKAEAKPIPEQVEEVAKEKKNPVVEEKKDVGENIVAFFEKIGSAIASPFEKLGAEVSSGINLLQANILLGFIQANGFNNDVARELKEVADMVVEKTEGFLEKAGEMSKKYGPEALQVIGSVASVGGGVLQDIAIVTGQPELLPIAVGLKAGGTAVAGLGTGLQALRDTGDIRSAVGAVGASVGGGLSAGGLENSARQVEALTRLAVLSVALSENAIKLSQEARRVKELDGIKNEESEEIKATEEEIQDIINQIELANSPADIDVDEIEKEEDKVEEELST